MSTGPLVTRLSIESFRGIPGKMLLDLRDAEGRASSLLLIGDNGTGKSSIADAIEFGLQGRIGRQKSLTSSLVASPMSFASAASPRIKIELSNGDIVERAIDRSGPLPVIQNSRAHDAFSVATFVLRRSDIVRFLETAEDDRQLMFLDYIGKRRGGDWDGSLEERVQAITAQRSELGQAIDRDLGKLCVLYKWEVPTGVRAENELDGLLRRRLYRGLKPRELAEKGVRIKLKSGADEILERIRSNMRQYKSVNRQSIKIKRPSVDFVDAMKTLKGVLADASDSLTESFRSISTAAFVKRLDIAATPGKEFSLHVNVHLDNKQICAPKQVLSEANQDLLALLMFLALVQEAHRRGQSACLILDDVFQSVDAAVRVAVMGYVVDQFRDWQLIVTAHDRLWYAQVRDILQRSGHRFLEREITRWSFDDGPVVGGARSSDAILLEEAMDRGDVVTICALAGVLHEGIADRLSWTLPVSVTRRPGDRYTLGDLWPPILKKLKKTNLAPLSEAVDRWVHLRNIAGAHYNEWSRSLSATEARNYGDAVLNLFRALHCADCGRWIERVGTASRWECRCEAKRIAEGEPAASVAARAV